MRRPALAAAAVLVLAASAFAHDGPPDPKKPSKTPDLSGQFADPPKRDQSDIGSCHAFASVAVLEAAYFRAQGHRIRFSEEDLFLQQTLFTGATHSTPCRTGLDCGLAEGNMVDADIRHALERGILTGSNYSDFVDRYREFRRRDENVRAALAKMRDDKGAMDFILEDEPQTSWDERLSDPKLRAEVRSSLTSRTDERVGAERAQIKKLLKGARLYSETFDWVDGTKISPEECRRAGADRLYLLRAELDAGRPLVVSMHLTGLKSWGAPVGQHFYHAFAITGYKPGKTGLRFQVRNSWAGVNPEVLETELCRIAAMDGVLLPSETEAFYSASTPR